MSSTYHPLEVLPDVVWRIVIKHLTSDDCRNCYLTCSYFERMLKPSIMMWNFKEVLPLILGKGESRIFGELMFRLSKKDMLNCRLVCQAWRTAMDDHIDRLEETTEMPNFEINFHNERQLDRLFSHIERYKLEPNDFKLKNVRLGAKSEEDFGPFGDPNPPMPAEALISFWQKGYVLLQSIGINITRAFIDGVMEYTPAGGLELTKLVQGYCKLMPNIKRLKIANQQYEILPYENHINFQNEINEIEDYLNNNPFPPLPHLKSLIIPGEFVPLSLIRHLISTYRTQIETLLLKLYDSIPRQLNLQMLSNLKKLEISVYNAGMLNETILNDLNFLEGLNCPLKHLHLCSSRHEPLPIVKFLEKIQHLPIEDLGLNLSMTYDEFIPGSLKLGTVKSLSLMLDCTPCIRFPNPPKIAFDFLECFKNIENLELDLYQYANTELPLFDDEKRIRLNECLNGDENLYQSNIWEVLPKLGRIKFERMRDVPFEELDLEENLVQVEDDNADEDLDDENFDQDEDGNVDEDLLDDENFDQVVDGNVDEDLDNENWIWEEDEEELDYFYRIFTRQQYEHFHKLH